MGWKLEIRVEIGVEIDQFHQFSMTLKQILLQDYGILLNILFFHSHNLADKFDTNLCYQYVMFLLYEILRNFAEYFDFFHSRNLADKFDTNLFYQYVMFQLYGILRNILIFSLTQPCRQIWHKS